MKAPLVPVALAFLTGILLGRLDLHPLLAPGCSLIALGVALAWRRTPSWALAPVLLLWVSLGMWRMETWEAHPARRLTALLTDEPQAIQLHGTVRDDPAELFSPNDMADRRYASGVSTARWVCLIEVRHVRTARGWEPIPGAVRAMVVVPRVPIAYGDEVLVEGHWRRVPAPGNPGQYDWRGALARRRVHGVLQVAPSDGLVVLTPRHGPSILETVYQLRSRWRQLIDETCQPTHAGLWRSLLLGERVALDESLKEIFVETGTMHLLAISGFNVGIIALVLDLLCRLLGLPWRLRLLCVAVGLGGYCLLAGSNPPVVRATLMAWVILGAYVLDRVVNWFNTLAVAALAIVWWNPTQLFDPGFQLSFGAVWSLLVLTPRWQRWLEPCLQWIRPGWLRRYLALSLCATSAVWVGLLPLLAWSFHLVSPVSVLANLLVTPLVSAFIAAGTPILGLATLIEPIMAWSVGLLNWLLDATLRCLTWCHAVPGGSWVVGHPSGIWVLGYYGVVGVLLHGTRSQWPRSRLWLVVMVGLTLWVGGTVTGRLLDRRWLRVDLLDVGHGDSILVRTPSGQALLVDGGTHAAGRDRVIPALRYEGIRTLDAVIVTHADEDHLGGIVPVLQRMRVKRLLTNGAADDTMAFRELQRAVRGRGIPHEVIRAGMSLRGPSGLQMEVLHPPAGWVPGTDASSNDNSVVLKLTKGLVSILLTGDIEEAGLPWLLASGESLRATVLKVPHHGSRLGEAGARFFEAVHPRIAIVSVGRLHQLPTHETLAALQRLGARLYSTREHGALRLRTDGHRLEVRGRDLMEVITVE